MKLPYVAAEKLDQVSWIISVGRPQLFSGFIQYQTGTDYYCGAVLDARQPDELAGQVAHSDPRLAHLEQAN